MTKQPQPLWIHPKIKTLPFDLPGPFCHGANGDIVTPSPDQRGIARSGNNGATWSNAPFFEYGPYDSEMKVSFERVLMRTAQGSLVLSFMNINEKNWLWRDELHDILPGTRLPHYVVRSADDGKTWSKPVRLHDHWTGDVRSIIQLRSGRLVLSSMRMLANPGRHTSLTYYSDDDGQTWNASNVIDLGGCGHHAGVIEAPVAELKNGQVLMLMRTNWKQFWRALSNDGGATWRDIGPSGIDASSAPAILHRLNSGRLLILWNRYLPEGANDFPLTGGDNNWSEVPVSNHREELTLGWYNEENHSVSNPVVIARQKGAWLSYPRVFERSPGELWITTMQGGLRLALKESDFA